MGNNTDCAVNDHAFRADIRVDQAGGTMQEGEAFAQLQNAFLNL